MLDNSIDQIEKRFKLNIGRVKNLVSTFNIINKISKKSVTFKQDLLRSAVVLLHASLEDLLREAIRQNPPFDNKKFVSSLMFETDGSKFNAKEKISMLDLITLKSSTVADLVEKSVKLSLDRRSFNHVGDIKEAIKQLGLQDIDFENLTSVIGRAMERRHKIVHRSDRNEHNEKTHGPPTLIARKTVQNWIDATNDFGDLLIKSLKERHPVKPLTPKDVE